MLKLKYFYDFVTKKKPFKTILCNKTSFRYSLPSFIKAAVTYFAQNQ